MADSVKSEITRLIREDSEVRRALLEALAKNISGFAALMRQAHETYPLKLRQ